jgi:hypothetical protein|tara:strand:+ start:4642 stop:4866 length:225 start_codon:yes stop_codon:yes gene_type:complete
LVFLIALNVCHPFDDKFYYPVVSSVPLRIGKINKKDSINADVAYTKKKRFLDKPKVHQAKRARPGLIENLNKDK